MNAYELFQKLAEEQSESDRTANQYLYFDGKELYHGFTYGGIHVWDVIQTKKSCNVGFLGRGGAPIHGEYANPVTGDMPPWVSAPDGKLYPFDEIKLAALDRKKLEKHWYCQNNFQIPWQQFGNTVFVRRLYSNSKFGLFRFEDKDFVFGDPEIARFPIEVNKITAVGNIGKHITPDFKAYDVSVHPTVPTILWSNGTTSCIMADYDDFEPGNGDLFKVKKENNVYTINPKKGKTMPINVKVPLDKAETVVEKIEPEVVEKVGESPKWEAPKNVENDTEKVSENVMETPEKVPENVMNEVKSTEEATSVEEEKSAVDIAQDVYQAAEFFEEELKTAFTNYKVLVKAVKVLQKKVGKDLKNSADSKELKEALAENKRLAKENASLKESLRLLLNKE